MHLQLQFVILPRFVTNFELHSVSITCQQIQPENEETLLHQIFLCDKNQTKYIQRVSLFCLRGGVGEVLKLSLDFRIEMVKIKTILNTIIFLNVYVCTHFQIPVASLEAFRALKLSRLESFIALKSIGRIGGFQGPTILRIGEFQGPKHLIGCWYFILKKGNHLDRYSGMIYLASQGLLSKSGKLSHFRALKFSNLAKRNTSYCRIFPKRLFFSICS